MGATQYCPQLLLQAVVAVLVYSLAGGIAQIAVALVVAPESVPVVQELLIKDMQAVTVLLLVAVVLARRAIQTAANTAEMA
jgi:hypothetical protein